MTTGVPTFQSVRKQPAPFVSTTVRQPSAKAVRTPCTTACTPRPSYKCVRPVSSSTGVVPMRMDFSAPPCPRAVGFLKPGISATSNVSTGVVDIASSAGTDSAQPDPSTTSTSCSAGNAARMTEAALSASAKASCTAFSITQCYAGVSPLLVFACTVVCHDHHNDFVINASTRRPLSSS